ncbi:MAG: glutamate--tRNA ligase [Candidatus Colwellbacteria bacterium]|jgi:glutamyl-tRNA synthetase|nr:glutamate--tRNA ligase [Candidatus Colwellbacteria bacterium]MCK9497656.1 glutamate--tRNA ligase [Candidatus Colwellbacteria bacterium]MDD3752806.1 glutamate--tRNA ligase [Candidatus Colwellbacteria bacterium]MDD4818922.1 glutamate--tRNA ligase [Candidatus Colwellbacteria bacterium]
MVRVRLAPSPTGMMHIGTARAALFVWIFAKQNNGKFILRIEDTDKERSKKEYEDSITTGLKKLGLEWDEFYRQSERTEIYKKYLKTLVEEGKAYPCFCSKEDIDKERKQAEKEKKAYIYSGKCSNLSKEIVAQKIEAGEDYVIRFRMPKEKINFNDMVRGDISYDASLIGDIVIAKSYDEPLYNFVVVIDDALMEISHIIRGEDHISNTPKQIAILRSLGFKEPIYAHLPLILNKDRSKMSKRGGDVALVDFLEKGYLPEAIINFLALLSWHPKDNQEIFSINDLISEFSMDRVQKGGSIFDYEKLDWINKKYISEIIPLKELVKRGQSFIKQEWKLTPEIMSAVRERLVNLADLEESVSFFFTEPDYSADSLFWKGKKGNTKNNLLSIIDIISDIEEEKFNKENIEKAVMAIIPKDKKGEYLWPLRFSLSGKKNSPGPFEIMEGLGKEKSIFRINKAIDKIS